MHEFGTQESRSPSPVPENNSDSGMQRPDSQEPQEDLGMQVPPSPGPQVVSSSFEARGKFHIAHIARPYMHLTLIHPGWQWGERLPSPKDSEQEGQPSEIAEVGNMGEPVCQAVHMLV